MSSEPSEVEPFEPPRSSNMKVFADDESSDEDDEDEDEDEDDVRAYEPQGVPKFKKLVKKEALIPDDEGS